MTINSLPNSSTGYSPFYLNYGYHPVLPVELLKGDEEVKIEAVDNFCQSSTKRVGSCQEEFITICTKAAAVL